jgi:hypothetical protein
MVSERAFFGVSAPLFAASAAVTIIWLVRVRVGGGRDAGTRPRSLRYPGGANRRLRSLDSVGPKRQGVSAPRVRPIRVPTTVSTAADPSLRSVGTFGRVPGSRHIESKGFFGASGTIPAENVWAHD